MNESGCIERGDSSRESMVVILPFGVRMTMKPPPPMPHEYGSVTPSTAGRGDRRVHGVAASLQRVDRSAGALQVDGGRGAAGPDGRRLLGGLAGSGRRLAAGDRPSAAVAQGSGGEA